MYNFGPKKELNNIYHYNIINTLCKYDKNKYIFNKALINNNNYNIPKNKIH